MIWIRIPGIIFFSIFLSLQPMAQFSSGGLPDSFKDKDPDQAFRVISINPPDRSELAREDSQADSLYLPDRFAKIMPVNYGIDNAGTWETKGDGTRIWRLGLKLDGALATGLYFKNFYLPEGCKMFIYDPDHKQVKGAYTNLNNNSDGVLATELITGDEVTVEIDISPRSKEQPRFIISDADYAYRFINTGANKSSDFCEVNINCSPEGDNWQVQKKAVVKIKIRVSSSSYWCTGTLLNNVRKDNKPYILTADHCAYQLGHYASVQDLENWIFYFDYESVTCNAVLPSTGYFTMSGAVKIAQGGQRGTTGSDFYLVRLKDNIPASKDVFYSGWSAIDVSSPNGVTIHHPNGDIKKISTYTTSLQSTGWQGNGLESHWEVLWHETPNGWGVTEGGSSGSPLFNNNGYLIGTLTGGLAACESSGAVGPDKPDYYGKFAYHWSSNGNADTAQLQPWLDPDNTGVLTLNGSELGIDRNVLSTKDGFIIYPNPAKMFFKLEFITFVPSEIKIIFYDFTGKQVKELDYKDVEQNIQANVSDLRTGVYILDVIFEGEIHHTKLFVR